MGQRVCAAPRSWSMAICRDPALAAQLRWRFSRRVGADTLEGMIEMRVLVSVDMEGIAGVVHGDDIRPGHSEYERNRKLFTAEVNAAVRGIHAYEADAQVLVTEAHAEFRNLLHEACDRIEREVPTALAGREAVRPLRFDGPVQLEVQVLRPQMTEHALLVPGMEREDGCTLRYAAPDFPTAYQVTELIATLGVI
jgi:D-aminopeptidase